MDLSLSQKPIAIGLAIDLVGAVFIGYEVLNRYSGKLVAQSSNLEDVDHSRPVLTDDYKEWEKKKYKVMAVGLGLLVLGFTMQIIGTLYAP